MFTPTLWKSEILAYTNFVSALESQKLISLPPSSSLFSSPSSCHSNYLPPCSCFFLLSISQSINQQLLQQVFKSPKQITGTRQTDSELFRLSGFAHRARCLPLTKRCGCRSLLSVLFFILYQQRWETDCRFQTEKQAVKRLKKYKERHSWGWIKLTQ